MAFQEKLQTPVVIKTQAGKVLRIRSHNEPIVVET